MFKLEIADRSAGSCSLDLKHFIGSPVQTWLGFFSADGKAVTDTIYTGLVQLLSSTALALV